MNSGNDIQHVEMMQGLAVALAMLGTLFLSLLGRWVGGVWTTLLATLAACLLAYQPLIGASLFAGWWPEYQRDLADAVRHHSAVPSMARYFWGWFETDLPRRILLALIPFTLCGVLLSFKRVPVVARLVFTIFAPAILLYWVFAHFDISVPRRTMLTHGVVPVSAAIFFAWALIEPIAKRTPGAAAPIIIGSITAGLAFLLMLSAENQAGLMAPLIPATAGGAVLAAVIAALIRKPIDFARGPVLLWLTLIAALFAFMWLDTEKLPVPYLYWIAAAPLLGWIPEIGPIHRLKPWKRETLRLILVIAPVIVAITLAFKQHKKEAAEAGDEYSWVQPAAPILPSQMPMPNTMPPPTITCSTV